jgi:anti-anti-sigma factor
MTRWSFDKKQQAGELVVSGAVTVSQVGELQALLLEALSQAPLVQVDLSQVEEIDVAGIQLLCAAHRLAGKNGRRLEVKNIGARVRQLIRNAGFAHASVCSSGENRACLWAQLA